jgi:putative colanic acid biosynthesis acetyltransferase WcaF
LPVKTGILQTNREAIGGAHGISDSTAKLGHNSVPALPDNIQETAPVSAGINPDPYLRPAFTVQNKFRRAFWALSWLFLFRLTPVPWFFWRSALLRLFGAKVGPRNFIYPSARIWAPWLLETEAVVTIGRGAEIYNPGGVLLKHHSIVSQGAYICGASHDYNDPGFPFFSKRIVLEAYSWIGARAIVLPGVRVGEGSVLGAGSVTARSLEPWWVYAGNPARRAKPRKKLEPPNGMGAP